MECFFFVKVIAAAVLVCVSADVGFLLPVAPQPYQQRSAEASAQIVRQASDVQPDGQYAWSYETSNGIAAQESGAPAQLPGGEQAERAQGSYSYTAPDGTPVQVSYLADENGFQPQGNVLPTPPPIPLAIQRSLEFNERNPEPQQQQPQRPQYARF